MKKRLFSGLLAFVMVLSMVPMSVFQVLAAETGTTTNTTTDTGTIIPESAITVLGVYKNSPSGEGAENLFDTDHQNTKWCVVATTGWVVFKLDQPHIITSMTGYHARQSNDDYDKTKAKNTKAYALQVFNGTGEPTSSDYGYDKKWTTVGEETNNTSDVKTTTVTMTEYAQYFRLHISDCGDNAVRFYGLELNGYFTTRLVHFLPGGAQGTMADAELPSNAPSYVAPGSIFTYAGKVFTGWKVEGGDDTLYAVGETIPLTGDITLVAQWRDAVNCAVTINPGTHGTGEPSVQQIKELQKLVFPAPPVSDDPENWLFLGWKVGEDPVLKQEGDELVITAPITVEAQWASYYSITFDPTELGEGLQDAIVVLHSKDYTMPECTFTPKDPAYAFAGWEWNGVTYFPGETITATETRLYKAKWVKGVAISKVNFPDDNFRAYVKTLAGANDYVFTAEELAAIKEIDCRGKEIYDLKGIEYFTSIEDIDCAFNKLTTLDLSKNVALKKTVYNRYNCSISNNPLTSVKFPPEICAVFMAGTKITSLNLENVKINRLTISKTPSLTSIKFGDLSTLGNLDISDTNVTSLDLTGAEQSLGRLYTSKTPITYLDLEGFSQLYIFDPSGSKLRSVNLKGCTSLKNFYCFDLALSSLDVSDTAVNDKPRRECLFINAKEGDNLNDPLLDLAKVSNLTGGTITNGIVHYSTPDTLITYDYDVGKKFGQDTDNAKIHVTILDGIKISPENFPDEVFRSSITDKDRLNADTNNNGYLSSAEISKITTMTLKDFYHYGTGVKPNNVKGIEYFTALTHLDISGLGLTSDVTDVNLSALVNLVTLDAYHSNITSLDISGCTKLTTLRCHQNNLTELNLSNNTKLTELSCGDNPKITSLDLTSLPDLTILNCDNTGITNLDVSTNKKLTTLWMDNSADLTPDLSQNPAMEVFSMVNKYENITELPKLPQDVIDVMEKLQGGWLDSEGVLHFNGAVDSMSFSIKTGNATIDSSDGSNRCFIYTRAMPDVEVESYKAILESRICIDFRVFINNNQHFNEKTDFFRFTMENGYVVEQKIVENSQQYDPDGHFYTFRCPVVAKEIGDNIKAELIIGGRSVFTTNYCFKQYLDALLKGKYDVTTKNLVKSILNYGAASQVAFEYKTDALVNKDLSPEDQKLKADASKFDGYRYTGPIRIDGYPIYARQIALDLVDRVGLKVYFQYVNDPWKEGQVDNYFFKLNGNVYTPYQERGYWCIDISGINIKDVDKYFDLTMEYGNPVQKSAVLHVSPYNYCYQVMHSSTATEATKNAVLALADYHDAAMAYVAAHA